MQKDMSHRDTQRTRRRSRVGQTGMLLGVLGLALGSMGGCETAGEGLFTGAAMGAVTGLAIGSLNHDAGEGAAVGAIVGGVAGSIIGDQNEDRREGYRYGSYRVDSYGRPHPYHRQRYDRCENGYRADDWWND